MRPQKDGGEKEQVAFQVRLDREKPPARPLTTR